MYCGFGELQARSSTAGGSSEARQLLRLGLCRQLSSVVHPSQMFEALQMFQAKQETQTLDFVSSRTSSLRTHSPFRLAKQACPPLAGVSMLRFVCAMEVSGMFSVVCVALRQLSQACLGCYSLWQLLFNCLESCVRWNSRHARIVGIAVDGFPGDWHVLLCAFQMCSRSLG